MDKCINQIAQPRRLRLGELMKSWRQVSDDELAYSLAEQQTTQTPIGRVMVSHGWLDEETLAEAIAYQADLPRGHLGSELVRAHADGLSIDLVVRYRVVFMGPNNFGIPVVAVASPLTEEGLSEITTALGEPPLQQVVREGEISVALRMLTTMLSESIPSGPLLGDMLIERGTLRREVFDDIMKAYRPVQHGRIGDHLVHKGVIRREVLEQVVQEQRFLFDNSAAA